MFLKTPPDSDATSAFYRGTIEAEGFVMNFSRLWAWRPQTCDAFSDLRGQLMAKTSLSPRECAVLIAATAASVGDAYCSLAWGTKLAAASDPSTAAAVLRGSGDDALDANATVAADVDALRAVGLSEQEIFDATALIAFRVAFTTVNGALGARPDWQLADAAPPAVREAVNYGRAVSERSGS
jgi:alkylhydroperoxidase family enzyme